MGAAGRTASPAAVHGGALGIDWREGGGYQPLLAADRSLFAWEWLRRDPGYRAAAADAAASSAAAGGAMAAARFGLVQFEDPGLGVPDARPLWCSAAHPYVLEVEPAGSDRRTDAFDLDRLRPIARLVPSSDAEHLLLSDGLRTVRLDGPPGCFGSAPVCLRFRIVGIASAEAPLLALRRLLALCRTGGFARSLHRPEPRAARWMWVLRAADGLAQGVVQEVVGHGHCVAHYLGGRAGEELEVLDGLL